MAKKKKVSESKAQDDYTSGIQWFITIKDTNGYHEINVEFINANKLITKSRYVENILQIQWDKSVVINNPILIIGNERINLKDYNCIVNNSIRLIFNRLNDEFKLRIENKKHFRLKIEFTQINIYNENKKIKLIENRFKTLEFNPVSCKIEYIFPKVKYFTNIIYRIKKGIIKRDIVYYPYEFTSFNQLKTEESWGKLSLKVKPSYKERIQKYKLYITNGEVGDFWSFTFKGPRTDYPFLIWSAIIFIITLHDLLMIIYILLNNL